MPKDHSSKHQIGIKQEREYSSGRDRRDKWKRGEGGKEGRGDANGSERKGILYREKRAFVVEGG